MTMKNFNNAQHRKSPKNVNKTTVGLISTLPGGSAPCEGQRLTDAHMQGAKELLLTAGNVD